MIADEVNMLDLLEEADPIVEEKEREIYPSTKNGEEDSEKRWEDHVPIPKTWKDIPKDIPKYIPKDIPKYKKEWKSNKDW